MVERKVFLANPRHQYRVSRWEEHDCSAYNKKNGDDYEYPSLSHFMDNINCEENGVNKSFSCKSKASIMYPNEKNTIVLPIKKEFRLLQVSKFVSFHGWTLIMRKMLETEAFLANPKHRYHVSLWEEHDCTTHNKKNGHYYEYPSLAYSIDEH